MGEAVETVVMPRKDPRPTARERAEAARDLLEVLAEEGPLEGQRLAEQAPYPAEVAKQAAHDLWEAGLVSYRLRTRSGTARTVLSLSGDGASMVSGS